MKINIYFFIILCFFLQSCYFCEDCSCETKNIYISNNNSIDITKYEKEIERLIQKTKTQQNIIDSLRYNYSELILEKQQNPQGYNGIYNFSNNKITLFCNKAPKKMITSCIHEIGHYIQDEYFFYSDFLEYQKIISKENNSISDYASTNIYEDFAENYRGIVTISYNYSKIPPLRSEYFKQKLKLRGVE